MSRNAPDTDIEGVVKDASGKPSGELQEFAAMFPITRLIGNIFRAADCPADHVRNRLSVVDVRLLCGETACHGDMLMWHPSEPVEAAALQVDRALERPRAFEPLRLPRRTRQTRSV